ncbi:hypothetical protein ACQ86G_15815 [Roseateles chitinivorans]|uniref:hypothetical protein n=1 Tax=Roseateles chitinivorans TaxID=2917965 RepID=UPI003D6678D5
MFKFFDQLCPAVESTDYWSDDALHRAADALDDFGPADWKALSEIWSARDAVWLRGCAEAMSSSARPLRVITLLLDMFDHEDALVKLACFDAIYHLVESHPEPLASFTEPIFLLADRAATVPGVSRFGIENLRDRLNSSARRP